jgi:hypothetical protein
MDHNAIGGVNTKLCDGVSTALPLTSNAGATIAKKPLPAIDRARVYDLQLSGRGYFKLTETVSEEPGGASERGQSEISGVSRLMSGPGALRDNSPRPRGPLARSRSERGPADVETAAYRGDRTALPRLERAKSPLISAGRLPHSALGLGRSGGHRTPEIPP